MSHFSLTKKFIFIHVPKTGGVAILHYLKMLRDLQKIQDLRDELGEPRSGWDDNHYYYNTTMKTLNDLYGGIHDFKDFNVFGVIRNPFDRMVSMYLHRLRKPKYNTPADQKVLDQGFEYWLLNTNHRADKYITTRSQLEWFDGCDNPNLICQSELNTKWLKEASNTQTMEGSLPVKHTSSTPASLYYQYHTPDTVAFVEEVFARDVAWGNYQSPKVMYDV